MSTTLVRAAVALALAIMLAGCAATQRRTPAIVIDGDAADWPAGEALRADAHFLYIRLDHAESPALQAAPETVALWIDADGSVQTGLAPPFPRAASSLGVDLVVEFSPQAPAAGDESAGGVRRGAAVYAIAAGGERTPVSHADIDLVFAPTHASRFFEIRVGRHAAASLVPALAGAGPVRAMFAMIDGHGQVVGWSDPASITLPPASGSPPLADAVIPRFEPGTIRVMSFNVRRGSPEQSAAVFGRLIQAIDPDIVLIQEWSAPAEVLEAWFTAHVPTEDRWRARAAAASGVAIVSRHQFEPLGPDEFTTAEGRPVRCIAAVARTPLGEIAVASLHLKCCGSVGTEEDRTRLAEAEAINGTLGEALASRGARPGLVIAGDLNLVGSRPPLQALASRLGARDLDLSPVRALVLGDAATYTWTDPGSEFAPGRLDYALSDPTTCEVVRAFVVDTARFTDAALARTGLDRTDSAASDHRPLVVDVRLR